MAFEIPSIFIYTYGMSTWKKIILLIGSVFWTCGVLYAQLPAVIETGVKEGARLGTEIGTTGSKIVTQVEQSARNIDNAANTVSALQTYPSSSSFKITKKPDLSKEEIQQIQDQIFQVVARQSVVEKSYPQINKIFQILSLHPDQYSGVFFKVDGKIFGATAAHIFKNKQQSLNKPLLMSVYNQGKWQAMVGEVVAINPMLDLALIGFESETASLIKDAFELETHVPRLGDKLSSHGFLPMNRPVDVPARTVLEHTPFSFRTSWPWPRVYRPGLCGSGVVNEEKKLVGMHIGSNRAEDADDDVGYVVPAWYLQMMARAYLNGGNETFPLIWNETKIGDLQANEYVSAITLKDENGKTLWKTELQPYFPYTQLREKVKELSPSMLDFTIQKMQLSSSVPVGWYASPTRKIRYSFTWNSVAQIPLSATGKEFHFLPPVPQQITPEFLATFQARPSGDIKSNFVSGTIFQTQYKGQTEIFGVVAAHTVAAKESSEMIGRQFLADVFDSETHQFVTIPAEIIQVSSADLLDGVLVRLYPEGKVKLHPLELNTQFPAYESTLKSHAFAQGENVAMNDRLALQHTPFRIYTTLSSHHPNLMGSCGGVVVDADNKIIGFQTGADSSPFGQSHDTGYVTPAWVMDLLVRAYHNEGQAKFPLAFDGHTLLELNVDEYITDIRFLNKSQNEIFAHNFANKFSYRKMQEWLDIFNPQLVEITVRRVELAGPDHSYLYSERADVANGRVYRYNFTTKQTEFMGTEEDLLQERIFNR